MTAKEKGGGVIMADNVDIVIQRQQKVVKGNELIQQTRYSLTMRQQKLLSYMISKIAPMDTATTAYTLSLGTFCDVCGLDKGDGRTLSELKEDIRRISSVNVWIETPQREILCHWLDRVWREHGETAIRYVFSTTVAPFLFGLDAQFTQYTLANVLVFRSRYGIRLYEIARSYGRLGYFAMRLDKFKRLMDATTYDNFADLRRKVIEPGLEDVNSSSDLRIDISYLKTQGRAIDGIECHVTGATLLEHAIANGKQRQILNREVGRRNAKQ